MPTVVSHNPGETQALGENWGRAAKHGLVIALSGDLGAGKTQLTKGIARGLGATDRVHSPTFSLVNIYAGGRLTLFHLDLYRLETREQILSAGLDEYLRPDGVTVIEWAERLEDGGWSMKDGRVIKVKIEAISESERRISHDNFGA